MIDVLDYLEGRSGLDQRTLRRYLRVVGRWGSIHPGTLNGRDGLYNTHYMAWARGRSFTEYVSFMLYIPRPVEDRLFFEAEYMRHRQQ